MGKIVLGIFTLLSFASSLEISKSKVFTDNIPPQNYNSGFSIIKEAKNSNIIEELFSKVIGVVEEADICKGGKYTIYPNYYYKEGKRVQNGYRSTIGFDCEFERVENYNILLSKLKTFNGVMQQNKINYGVDKLTKEKYLLTLENRIYDYAKAHSEFLNEQFKNCEIKAIDINQNNQPVPYFREAAISVSAKSTPPIKEDIKVQLNAAFKFECDSE